MRTNGARSIRRRVADEMVVQSADGCCRLARRQVGEGRRFRDLHAHEMGRSCRAGRREPPDASVGTGDDAAVAGGIRMRSHGERHGRPGPYVVVEQLAEAEVAERVAVDDEEAWTEEGQRLPGATGRAEQDRFPGVAHAHAGGGAVSDAASDRLGKVVQVEDRLRDPLAGEPVQDAKHQRPARDGNRGLRPDAGERSEALPASGREHEGGRHRRGHRGSGRAGHYSKTMSPSGRRRRAQSASWRVR